MYLCAGTVIGREWVLTTAHCGVAMKREAGSATLFIREGTNDLNGDSGQNIAINAEKIIIHSRYDPRLTQNDIALLKLSGQASAPQQRLASRNDEAIALKPGRRSTVVGFSPPQANGSSSIPVHQLEVSIVAPRDCRKVHGANRITGSTVCAGLKKGGKDACTGTSGGPLSMPRKNGEQIQIGIVSWGKGCGQAGYPTVYVPVAKFQDWIWGNVHDAVFAGGADPIATQPVKGANDGSGKWSETR